MAEKPIKNKRFSKNVIVISTIGMILSIIGIADSLYLTIAHYSEKVTLACPDTGIINCAKVTTSSYSEVFGIPIALFGLIFFVGMLAAQSPYLWNSGSKIIRNGRVLYSITGILAIFWLVYVELHKLHAICLYCTGVHALTFLLFVTTIIGTSLITFDTEEEPGSN